MAAAITDLDELRARLTELPAPADGCARVFRGQTRDYGVMRPSSLRPGKPSWNRLWDMTLTPMVNSLLGTAPSSTLALDNVSYWFKVLAQHYGPASPFIDVTRSLDVALWFALHESTSHDVLYALTQGDTQMPCRCPSLSLAPTTTASGWLYVLDVPVWDGTGVPRHGELVDLEGGPPFVADAPRVQRQHGSLIAAETDVDGGDLAACYACPPIPVGSPFSGVPLLSRPPQYFFPSPEDDEWFARLLRAPFIPQPDGEFGYAYRQSLGVYLVTPGGTADQIAPFVERQVRHLPPLTRLFLRSSTRATELADIMSAYHEAATYVSLEAPLLSAFPPVTQLWNESLLLTALPDSTEPEETPGGALLPAVSLRNVLLEFSPIDWAFRETPGEASCVQTQCRAIWLVRRDEAFIVTLFLTTSAQSDVEMHVLHVEFSPREGTFVIVGSDSSRTPLTQSAEAKPFFVALAVLRELFPGIKPEASLGIQIDRKGFLALRSATARLVRPLADPAGLRLHFVRYRHADQRFEGPLPIDEVPPPALLELELRSPFERLIGLESVFGRVRSVTMDGFKLSFPAPPDGGHSADAARDLLSRFPLA
ncbi:MAG TPA: FRG domain-containing protein [Vicinamibacterales bacterium]|nr:FRG domain-containing protein [Vicinamibacterales bacterium]